MVGAKKACKDTTHTMEWPPCTSSQWREAWCVRQEFGRLIPYSTFVHVVAQTNAAVGGVHPDPYTPSRGEAAPSTSDVPRGCGGGCEPIEESSGHHARGFAQDRHEGGTAEGMARRSRRESPTAHRGESSPDREHAALKPILLISSYHASGVF